MTTWGSFLEDLRLDLQDTSETNPVNTDRLLYIYARDAIRDYSQYFPLRKDGVEIAVADGRYPLPADYVDEILVEAPKGSYLSPRPLTPGIKKVTGTLPQRYEVTGGGIYLDAPYTKSIWLTYYAYHAVPTSESATEEILTIPDGDLELPRLYVRIRIAAQLRSKTARNDRYREDARRDDNPLEDEYQSLMAEYQNKIITRTDSVAVILRRG